MAGQVRIDPCTPLLLQGTSQINFKAAVPGAGGVAKDTELCFVYILATAVTAAQVLLAGYLDSAGAPATILLVGSTSVDMSWYFPLPLLNQGGVFAATPGTAAKVWLGLRPYLGGQM